MMSTQGRWLPKAALAALAAIAASSTGCTQPIVSVADTGSGIDAARLPVDAAMPDADANTPVVDAAPSDAGTDSGGVTAPISVSGGVGSRGGSIPVSGSLVVVDDGFDLGELTCNGSMCVYGGFR